MECGHLAVDKFGRCENCFVSLAELVDYVPIDDNTGVVVIDDGFDDNEWEMSR